MTVLLGSAITGAAALADCAAQPAMPLATPLAGAVPGLLDLL
jgi:hypothetical protein